MLIKKRKIESFLPVFNGFYNSIFEASEDHIIEDPYNFDNYDFEYDTYREDMAKACCHAIERELTPLGITVEYQNVYSPRFYNFETDSINCVYRLKPKSAKLLNQYLLDNKDAFEAFIRERCTSRSGFISFFSNDVSDWLTEYTHKKLEHTFGTMLQFYFENEGYTHENLHSDVDHINLQGGLKSGVEETTEFIIDTAKNEYSRKPLETIVIELCQHFVNEGIEYDFLTYKYIEDKAKEVFTEIDNKTLKLFA